MNKEKELIDKLIDLAFAEDIGDGDHTTLSCIPATAMGKSKLLIKEAGVLAGIEVAKEIFNFAKPSTSFSGWTIIKWQSKGSVVIFRKSSTILIPNVILLTNTPSITST